MTAKTATTTPKVPSPKVPADLLNLLDSFPDPKILLDGHYRILAANTAYQREFGPNRKLSFARFDGER